MVATRLARARIKMSWTRFVIHPSREVAQAVNPKFTGDLYEPHTATFANVLHRRQLRELQGLYRAKPGEENNWRVFSYNKCE